MKEIRDEEGFRLTAAAKNESEDDRIARELENADKTQMASVIFAGHVKTMQETRKTLRQNLVKLWGIVHGQCTPALQEELSGDPEYAQKSADFDSIWLLRTLQKITAGANKTTNAYVSAFKANKAMYNTCQQRNKTLESFFGRMENARTTVELFNTKIADFDKLLAIERMKSPATTRNEVFQKYLSIALIMNASHKYDGLWTQLENNLLIGQDTYPTTIAGATHLLSNWREKSVSSFNQNRTAGN